MVVMKETTSKLARPPTRPAQLLPWTKQHLRMQVNLYANSQGVCTLLRPSSHAEFTINAHIKIGTMRSKIYNIENHAGTWKKRRCWHVKKLDSHNVVVGT